MKTRTHSFHNTIDLFSVVLEKADKEAMTKEDIVLDLFKRKPLPKTAEEVMAELPFLHPSTVRRSLSNLSHPRKRHGAALIKTKMMKLSGAGKPCHHWKLNEPTN
jgi:hypothetical protein